MDVNLLNPLIVQQTTVCALRVVGADLDGAGIRFSGDLRLMAT